MKLFLTNDHPAFTFPFLRPPNDIPIGCSNILGTRNDRLQLPVQVLRFLEESVGRDVVYVSFGSLVTMDQLPWFTEIIEILTKLDLRVIVRVGKGSVNKFPQSVLPLSWAPQKALLKSGELKLFISHYGNNGRLETIYYNVPVLCVPQFGDQPVNVEIINDQAERIWRNSEERGNIKPNRRISHNNDSQPRSLLRETEESIRRSGHRAG